MHSLTIGRMVTEAVLTGADAMPQADPWTQYGPAGALLTAFAIALTALFRWAAPLISSWVLSRVALTDSVRKTHEETAAENRLRFEQIQRHFEHLDERVDKMYAVMKNNCGKGLLESDEEMESPKGVDH